MSIDDAQVLDAINELQAVMMTYVGAPSSRLTCLRASSVFAHVDTFVNELLSNVIECALAVLRKQSHLRQSLSNGKQRSEALFQSRGQRRFIINADVEDASSVCIEMVARHNVKASSPSD